MGCQRCVVLFFWSSGALGIWCAGILACWKTGILVSQLSGYLVLAWAERVSYKSSLDTRICMSEYPHHYSIPENQTLQCPHLPP